MAIYHKLYKVFNDNKNIIINILLMIGIKGLSMVLSLLLFPAYIAFLDNNIILGIWFTILSVMNWVFLFDLGLGNGLRNKLTEALTNKEYTLAKKYITTTYCYSLFLSIAFFLLYLTISDLINWRIILNIKDNFINDNELTFTINLVVFGILLQFILKIITSIMYSIQKPALVNLMGFLSNIIIFVALLVCESLGKSKSIVVLALINVFAMNAPLFIYTVYAFNNDLCKISPSIKFFDHKCGKELLSIGIVILWLQIISMIILCTNEYIITLFTNSKNVVEYQAYNKLYNSIAIVFSFALAPIWSAVTKAQAENNFLWIKKCYKIFLAASVGCFLSEIILTSFGNIIFEFWIKNTFEFNLFYGFVFSLHSFILILHNINTSISNGLSYFRFQCVGMFLAALTHIPLSYFLVKYLDSWIGVILSCCLSMLFYEFLAPFFTLNFIGSKIHTQKYQ